MRALLIGTLMTAVLPLSVACAPRATPASEAGEVVEAFLTARQARDLDATMATFGDAPELRSSQGINWSGRDAVRAIMAYRIQDAYAVGDRHVAGNVVTWGEHVRRTIAAGSAPANFDEDVEVTVVGGHIQTLVTYLGGRRAPAPVPPVGEPITLGFPWVLPLSLALLVLAVLVWPTEHASVPPRQAPGRLLVALRRYAESHGTQSREE